MVQTIEDKDVVVYHYQPKMTDVSNKDTIRVAAYARVSTLSENQEESFETQCAYYEKYVASHPNMILVGVYGDQGISGLHMKGRMELLRMMEDCIAGKIDYVLTRSVSRMSRNMTECLDIVNKLKEMGIPVRFEKEGVTSTDPQGEFMLEILAILAQEESCSHSRRLIWAQEQRAKIGDPIRKCPYGYKKAPVEDKLDNDGGRGWVIDESESMRVKKAFEMASELCPYQDIIAELDLIEQAEHTGISWNRERLRRLFKNEAYRGDVLTNKTYTVDYLSGMRAVNRGKRTQYYISAHHEPVIPPETYERVNSLMKTSLLRSNADCKREQHRRNAVRWKHEQTEAEFSKKTIATAR